MLTRVRPVIVITILAAAIAVICVGAARHHEADSRNDPPGYDVFLESVRAGVLARVPAAPRGGKLGTSRQAVTAATEFIASRSGIVINQVDAERLIALQDEYEAGTSQPVDADLLASHIADWTVDDVLMTATNAEVDESVEAARGFDAPDLPTSFKNGRGKIRFALGHPAVYSTPDEARFGIAAARTDTEIRDQLRIEVREGVSRKLSARTAYLQRADAGRFDSTDLSPVECLLLVYSLAADDMLAGSTEELRVRMHEAHKELSRMSNVPYPAPQGRLAYGANGYIVSTPAPVFMARLSSLFDRVAGGGAQ